MGRGGGASSAPSPTPVSYSDTAHVLLVNYRGQSNMQGRGRQDGLPPVLQVQQQGCYMFHNTAKTFDILQAGQNDPANPNMFGPELRSLMVLRDTYGCRVYGVKTAQGGTSLAPDGSKNDWSASTGELLASSHANVTNAKTKLEEMGKTVTVVDAWWQGESDADNEAEANAYLQNETDLFALSDTIPALQGTRRFVYKIFERNAIGPYWSVVNQAKLERAAADPRTTIIENNHYSLGGDLIHADANGQVTAGEDLGNAIIASNVYSPVAN